MHTKLLSAQCGLLLSLLFSQAKLFTLLLQSLAATATTTLHFFRHLGHAALLFAASTLGKPLASSSLQLGCESSAPLLLLFLAVLTASKTSSKTLCLATEELFASPDQGAAVEAATSGPKGMLDDALGCLAAFSPLADMCLNASPQSAFCPLGFALVLLGNGTKFLFVLTPHFSALLTTAVQEFLVLASEFAVLLEQGLSTASSLLLGLLGAHSHLSHGAESFGS